MAAANHQKHRFQVEGMTCNHCVRAITQAVQAEDPKAQVEVNLKTGQVLIESDQPAKNLARLIEEEGYKVQEGT